MTTLDYNEAEQLVAAGEFQSITEAQETHRLKQYPIATSPKLQADRDRIAKLQSELDQKEAEQAALVGIWDSMLRQRDNLSDEISFGEGQFQGLPTVQEATEFIHGNGWGQRMGTHKQVGQIIELYANVAAIELARADFEVWVAGKKAALSEIEARIADFAKLHKIPLN